MDSLQNFLPSKVESMLSRNMSVQLLVPPEGRPVFTVNSNKMVLGSAVGTQLQSWLINTQFPPLVRLFTHLGITGTCCSPSVSCSLPFISTLTFSVYKIIPHRAMPSKFLVFRMWKAVGHVVGGCCQAHYIIYCAWQRPPNTCPTTFHVWKTRGCRYSFRLLMMGSVLPETFWASYKYWIIKFWYIVASCWIFLYELDTECFSKCDQHLTLSWKEHISCCYH